MRIAFLVHGYPPADSGGVELVAKEQAEALTRRGHEVAVLARVLDPARADGECLPDESIGGVTVRRVANRLTSWRRFPDFDDHDVLDVALQTFLDDVQPDLLHVQHLVLLSSNLPAIARARGVPGVLSLHDFFYLCHRLFLLDREGRRCPGPARGERCIECLEELAQGDEARQRFARMERALSLAEALIAASPSLARRYAIEMPELADRIEVVEPGIARSAPAARPYVGPDDAASRPLELLFIGTLLRHKGIDLLVEVLRSFDPTRYRLTVHGAVGGEGEGFLRDLMARAQGLPLVWAGAFPPEEIDAVLARADVLVLPSRCDEGWSRVVREARAAGLAVIAPSAGGPGDALRHGVDAMLIEPDSADSLRAALATLLDDPGLVRRLGSAPATWPTSDQAAERLEGIYRRVLDRVAS